MKLRLGVVLAAVLVAGSGAAVAAENEAAQAARSWRQQHERAILEDYFELLRIPNVSRDRANVRRNAEHIVKMMERRGITAKLLEVPDPKTPADAAPVVYGEILTPGATRTYVFYAHYDGQPVDAKDWVTPPFEPTLRSAALDKGGQVIAFPPADGRFDPQWRLYARAASDDKAQVFAMLTAADALRAAGLKRKANIKFIFEGAEEIGSQNLDKVLRANQALLTGDLWLICDGPEHSSGRQTIMFGARGVQLMEITVYGPNRALHSGHYGNWAPNPAMMLAQLLGSMKDASGRVLVKNFYDGVVPLSPLETKAIADMPQNDADLKREFGLGTSDGEGKRLQELINQPSLNIRGFASGAVGEQAANVIPPTATAAIDLRLVKGVTHEGQVARVIDHIKAQGYYVTSTDPDEATRLAHAKIAKVTIDHDGYNAVRTQMDLPVAQKVMTTIASVRSPVVYQPTSGGSVPLDMIEDILKVPTISIPLVNYDNNQHAKNENIKLQNLWNAFEVQAALQMMD
jgi:acetylornithine deacetylase/succinyl-diaminopimelate desuccinylase-like protein